MIKSARGGDDTDNDNDDHDDDDDGVDSDDACDVRYACHRRHANNRLTVSRRRSGRPNRHICQVSCENYAAHCATDMCRRAVLDCDSCRLSNLKFNLKPRISW